MSETTTAEDATQELVRPLAGLTVLEQCAADSNEVSRAAAAFAGLLCVRFGAQVMCHEFDNDPMKCWPPLLGDGTSAAFRFLNRGKMRVLAGWVPAADLLLTNDPDLVRTWHGQSSVVVKPAFDGSGDWSELTIQAASGLLDIFGEPGRTPLPLPGRLTAYAAGMAAFDAIVASHLTAQAGRGAEPAEVSVLDTALWVNWKHLLAAEEQRTDTGIGRAEDWQTIRCRDGYFALIFQEKDLSKLAALTGDRRLLAPEFGDRASRAKNVDTFIKIISDWAHSHSRSEIVERARELGIPIGPVLDLSELPGDRQFRHRRFLRRGADGTTLPDLPLLWDGRHLAETEKGVSR